MKKNKRDRGYDEAAARLYDEHEQLERDGNKAAAMRKLQEAASLGAPYAISALAYVYYNDYSDRLSEALQLYRRAVRKGDYLSAWNLARHYELKPDARRYFFWLERASAMGMEEAGAELDAPFPYAVRKAREYLKEGHLPEARRLLRLAAAHGNKEAARLLSRLTRDSVA
jgi:TPR repeat protein